MNLSTIEKEAINKINSVKDLDELEKNRLFYLGKKGIISQEMKKLSNLSIKEKKDLGKKLNEIKKSILINIDKQKNIIEAKEKEIADLLEPLGFYNKRAKTLQKMSEGYLKGFTDVIELFGVGKYAKDSWELFQNNNRNIDPTDKVLTEYLRIT